VDGDAEGIGARLRTGEPAVLGRIEEGRLVLDVRCLEDRDLGRLAAAVATAREPLPGV
jgi:L-seryl-tRNA(Ser) seleniumtransferase